MNTSDFLSQPSRAEQHKAQYEKSETDTQPGTEEEFFDTLDPPKVVVQTTGTVLPESLTANADVDDLSDDDWK